MSFPHVAQFEINCDASNASTPATKDNIQQYVRSKQQGLQLLVKQKLDRYLPNLRLRAQVIDSAAFLLSRPVLFCLVLFWSDFSIPY
jgi:hypothetical protein